MGAVIAVDHGEKKSGFAVADALRIVVAPLEQVTLAGDGDALLDHIGAMCEERAVETFLVGMPLNMDGTLGGRAKSVQAFIARLRARFTHIDVVAWDERLTTKEAESLLRDAGYSGREAKARRDSWSALVLLRDWLASGEPR
jgi:putative Holliday junction resolvase